MPNLEGIGLQNFRTFKDKEYLDFAPITLITGTNNSGKSSIIKAILLLKDNFKSITIPKKIDLSNFKHELGTLNRLYNNSNTPHVVDKRTEEYEKQAKKCEKDSNRLWANTPPKKYDDLYLSFTIPIFLGSSHLTKAKINLSYNVGYKQTTDTLQFIYLSKIELIHENNMLLTTELNKGNNNHLENVIITTISPNFLLKALNSSPNFNNIDYKKDGKRLRAYYKYSLFEKIEKKIKLQFDLRNKSKLKSLSNIHAPLKKILDTVPEAFYSDRKLSFTEMSKLFGKGINSKTITIENFKIKSEDYDENDDNEELGLLDKAQLFLFNEYSELSTTIKNSNQPIFLRCNSSYGLELRGFICNEKPTEEQKKKEEEDKKREKEEQEKLKEEDKKRKSLLNVDYINSFIKNVQKEFELPLVNSLYRFKKVYYLSANRGKYRNWFLDEQSDEIVRIFQEYAELDKALKKNKKSKSGRHYNIRNYLSFWLGKGEITENSKTINKGFNIGESIIIKRIEDIGLTQIYIEQHSKNGEKKTIIPLVDLGYGLSQIIPIIMKIAVLAHKHYSKSKYSLEHSVIYNASTLIIEEPESNLHPNLQSKLAEMLIDAGSRFNIQFILETHSEYMIYKFQEYIGKKIIRPKDVKMYYLNHPDDVQTGVKGKYINDVKIESDGSIDYKRYFGTGFFDEQTDLGLSLLNIQRNSFIHSFQKTKEKFQNESTISEENQFEELSKAIDKHFEKLDYTTYENRVKTEFPSYSKFQLNTTKYLAAAYHLIEIYGDNHNVTDYAPAVIQFGRAVESEMMYLFKSVKDYIIIENSTDYHTWIRSYNNQINNSEIVIAQKHDFKNYMKETGDKEYRISFGQSKNILELIRTESNSDNVELLKVLRLYLTNQFFKNWENVKTVLSLLPNIVDKRNSAAHTYHQNGLSQQDAIDYKRSVEKLLTIWANEMKKASL